VKLVCLPDEADLINSQGVRVRIPIRGRTEAIELDSRKLLGRRRRERRASIRRSMTSSDSRSRNRNTDHPECGSL
jgi:hypothetical protein